MIVWTTCALAFLSGQLCAQDQLFSLQNATPMQLNPALSGNEYQYRASVLYRSQWKTVAAPFQSVMASFDMRHGKKGTAKNGSLGSGLALIRDVAGDVGLNTTRVMYNLAYHVNITENSKIGAGLHTSISQINIDPAAGKWGSQYNGISYDPGINSGESFAGDMASNLNLGGGIVYTLNKSKKSGRKKKYFEIEAGVAGYQLGSMRLIKSDRLDYKESARISAFAESKFTISQQGLSLMPAVYYHYQNGSQQVLAGSFIAYEINDASAFMNSSARTAVSLGTFVRAGDAFVLKTMFEWSDFAMVFAYDINYSGLTKTSNGRGAAEIGIIWRD